MAVTKIDELANKHAKYTCWSDDTPMDVWSYGFGFGFDHALFEVRKLLEAKGFDEAYDAVLRYHKDMQAENPAHAGEGVSGDAK